MSESTHARGANLDAIVAATGRGWEDWTAWLEDVGAHDVTEHAEVAALVLARLREPGGPAVPNPEWWAQSVTVAWEQHTGRRAPGQRTDGTFDANASRTVPGTMDEALSAVQETFGAAIDDGGGGRGLEGPVEGPAGPPVRCVRWRA